MTETAPTQSIIGQIRKITANAVAKKQDAAKLNYPKIIERITNAATRGESFLFLRESECGEYDKQLLEKDGFKVWYTDMPQSKYDKMQYLQREEKGWRISW